LSETRKAGSPVAEPTVPSRRRKTAGARPTPVADDVFREATFSMQMGIYELSLSGQDADGRLAGAIGREEVEFALLDEGEILLLCFRFEATIPWTVAHYESPKGASRESYSATASESGEIRALLAIAFRDAETGREVVRRNLTLSLDFTRAANEAIREQACGTPDPRARRRAIDRLTRDYPNATSMAARCAVRSFGIG